jgi:hypothetical protein
MQSLYRNRLAGRLAPFLLRVLPPPVREILALVYSPRLLSWCRKIEGELSYRHPSTGEARRGTIRALFRESVERSAALCLGLEPLLLSKSPLPDSWRLPPVDPSLGFGREAALRFYAPERFFE